MKQLQFRTRFAVALLASTALLGTAVLAAADSTAGTKAPAAKAQANPGFTLKVSNHAATALSGIGVARMALMQWSGDQAKTILTQVKDTLAAEA